MRRMLLACLVVALVTGGIYASKPRIEVVSPDPRPAHLISSIDDVFRHF